VLAVQDEDGWIGIAVSNRQKVLGVTTPTPDKRLAGCSCRSNMPLAVQNRTADQYIADLERKRAENTSRTS
jgi:hypothetical protein